MLAGVLCASASFATDYYVSVEGSGEKNGSSWENAIAFTEIIKDTILLQILKSFLTFLNLFIYYVSFYSHVCTNYF